MKGLGDLATVWPQLHALLDEALALPAPQRAAWLQALPQQHAPLRDTLARLLDAGAGVETDDFLGTLPKLGGLPGVGPGADDAGAPQPGDEVGPYRLLSELGQGGMGSVWLAERFDGQMRRQVALKLPRLTWARGLAERMARERDILATLEHPHIARLYDAGVDRIGRPWLALEWVQGRAIDTFVREEALPVAQRLALLLQVCEAVSYAHGRLVIHRDLKPGNILVTDDRQVRLLDFGIAKLMQGEEAAGTALTLLAGRAMTLDYASPEQVRGEPLTTASDVYSLGVVAYEVLAGARPYRLQRGSAAELEEAIAQIDPPRASDATTDPRVRRALRGDLDAVLNKALKKNPQHRYPTVDALAQDLLRHLRHEPVSAQPDALSYRTAKFVARYRLQVGAAAAVVVALLAGLAAAWDQAQRAERERLAAVRANEQARANEQEAQRQARMALQERASAQAAGEQAASMAQRAQAESQRALVESQRALIESQRAQAESLRAQKAAAEAREAAEQARSQARRAEEVKRFVLSLFERADTESGAGLKTTALELLQQAHERIDRELRDQPAVAFELKSSLARSLGALGDTQGALQVVESLVGPQAPRVEVPRVLEIDARIMHAEWLPRIGRHDEALKRLRELEEATRAPDTPRAQRVATMRMLSVSLLQGSSAYQEAVDWADRAARLADGAADVPELVQMRAWMALANARQIARQPGVLEPARRALALAQTLYPARTAEPVLEARQFVALGLSSEGRLREAIAEYQTLVTARIELLGPTHNSLAGLYNSLGNARLQAGEPADALAAYQALLAVVDANDRGPTVNRAIARFRVAQALASLRRLPEAMPQLEAALAMSEAVGGPAHPRSLRWRASLASMQARAGELTAAETTLARIDRGRLTDSNDSVEVDLNTSTVRSLQGRHTEALVTLEAAERVLSARSNTTMQNSARTGTALAHFRAGRAGDALPAIEEAERLLSRQDAAGSPDLADVRLALGRARLDRGDPTGAIEWMRRAEGFWSGFAPDGPDAARLQGHLALALAATGDRAAAAAAARARTRLTGSARDDDRRLLDELARAGL